MAKEYDTSDPSAVGERTTKAKAADLARIEGLRHLMDNPNGRRWMWELLSRCGLFRLSFDRDSHATAFNEGSRNIGLPILADLQNRMMPLYTIMINESSDY